MHCIWDFNGTLLGDVHLALEADNRILALMGMPAISLETYRRYMRNPLPGFYEDLGCDLQKYPYAWINREFLDYFNPRVVEAGLMPGTLEVLEALARKGVTHSILSSSYEPSLKKQARALGLTPYMCEMTGMLSDLGERKEERGLHQLERLGIDRSEAVLIGDTTTDAFVAAHMGVRCVLVTWGHNGRDQLAACGVPVADTHAQLLEVLEQMQ